MFGYIVFNQQELKIKEYECYRAYYCGLCRTLRSRYGLAGEWTLSYDTTFLALLLSGLYEPEEAAGETRCLAHPFEAHPTRIGPSTEYAADINLILSYYSTADDWSDEHSLRKGALSVLLRGKQKKACERLPEKAAVIRRELEALHEDEQRGEQDIDKVAAHFGEIMAEVFAMHADEWEKTLRRMGFYLGKFIYLLDAYDDLEKDEKSGAYNPLSFRKDEEGFEPWVQEILTMMMAECCKCFETLPILNHLNILRNILYSGVWSKFVEARKRRTGEDMQTTPFSREEEQKEDDHVGSV